MTYQTLTPDDALLIYKDLQAGESQQALAIDFGVSQQTISAIKTGNAWGAVTGARGPLSPWARVTQAVLTEDDVMAIDRALREGTKCTPLAAHYGVTYNSISHIKHGTTWGWLTGRGTKQRNES